VFLPGQVATALQAQQLSLQAQQQLRNLNENLTDKAWWKKQEGAQLTGSIKAYSDTLASFTASLLGFDLASPPSKPAPLSISRFHTQLATDVFDQNAANQLIQEAALNERLMAGEQLAKAVNDFSRLSASAISQELQSNPKKLQQDVQASLRLVNKEIARYNARISAAHNYLRHGRSSARIHCGLPCEERQVEKRQMSR